MFSSSKGEPLAVLCPGRVFGTTGAEPELEEAPAEGAGSSGENPASVLQMSGVISAGADAPGGSRAGAGGGGIFLWRGAAGRAAFPGGSNDDGATVGLRFSVSGRTRGELSGSVGEEAPTVSASAGTIVAAPKATRRVFPGSELGAFPTAVARNAERGTAVPPVTKGSRVSTMEPHVCFCWPSGVGSDG
jgi:hypothetical protein